MAAGGRVTQHEEWPNDSKNKEGECQNLYNYVRIKQVGYNKIL